MEEKLLVVGFELIRQALMRLNFSVKILELQISSGLKVGEKLFQELLEDKGIRPTEINEELEKKLQEQRLQIEATLDKLTVLSLKLQGVSDEEIDKILGESSAKLEELAKSFQQEREEMRLEGLLAEIEPAKKGN